MTTNSSMSSIENSKSESHPMIRDLLDAVVPFLTNDTPIEAETAESYIVEVFDAIAPMIQSFALLDRTRKFVAHMPSEKYLQGLEINRHDWLEYHIGTFLIVFVTIRDQCLLLINAVMGLGIAPQHCRLGIITSNKWVKDTVIPNRLNLVEKAIERHRKNRNLIVHRGKTPLLDDLCKTRDLDQLEKFALVIQHKPEAFSEQFKSKVDQAYVRALIRIDKGLEGEICQLRKAVWPLLTDTHKIYNQRLSAFSAALGKPPKN